MRELGMRRNTEDKTLERNYQSKWRFLIKEYEQTKAKKHPFYRFVGDFYHANGINRQTFCKYYNRYRNSGLEKEFLPRKRGPRWESRRTDIEIEKAVIEERKKGINKYEICAILAKKLGNKTPSPSGIYNIIKRAGMNKLSTKEKEVKRKIIREKAGELAHIDCHYLSKDMIINESKRYYLVCVIDDASRIAWAEVLENIQSLNVMFAVLRCFNYIKQSYSIQFKEVMTDNGPEFASRSNLDGHPFERMLVEIGLKHLYTRPYRPQTNGKVERFWRTLNDDLIEGTTFETAQEFKDELFRYLIYYNEHRPHQALGGIAPLGFLQNLSMN
ncbi:integrase core domain-containing protein [Wolbachia endosymbiont of Folsomia candida]|uniref:integrase core domain-containing protein n=1 Tax=Wolbachia endosymbiont of Folsomia candida TaxID=169402 RepID=UPI0013003D66|nr:integrase core domain-containing protein [Wolbachia endosymbiont of Folsomia candida]